MIVSDFSPLRQKLRKIVILILSEQKMMKTKALLKQICRHVSSSVYLILIPLLSTYKQKLVFLRKIYQFFVF